MQVMHALLNDATNLRDFIAQSYKILYETSFEAYQGFAGAEPIHSPSPAPTVHSQGSYPPAQSPGPYTAVHTPNVHSQRRGGAWNGNGMS